jgi:sugar lactone lactonase YvrE
MRLLFAICVVMIPCAPPATDGVWAMAGAAYGSPSPSRGPKQPSPSAILLADGLQRGSGSTVGPDGAIYLTDGTAGRIYRLDPQTGSMTTFAAGLPQSILGIGGAMDIAFAGGTAYVIVTLVGPDIGDSDVVGLYRIDGPATFTVVADIGAFALQNPPDTDYFVDTGVQYAMEPYREGFLVTDGHHNRLLYVTLNGAVSVFQAFDNIVPTGLAISGNTILMGEAGALPHLPVDGRIVSLDRKSGLPRVVASGARLLVDVEYGRGQRLYALSQGIWPLGGEAGSPALENTGALMEVNGDGTVTPVVESLNQPTSVEFIGNTAYVVTLGGEIWRIDNVSRPPFGRSH